MLAMVDAKLESSNRLRLRAQPKLAKIRRLLMLSRQMLTSRRVADEEEEEILNLKSRVRMLVLTRIVRVSKILWRTIQIQPKREGIEADEETRLLREMMLLTRERIRGSRMARQIRTKLLEMTSPRVEPRVASPTIEEESL